jgi:tRNA-dihydrouridine synthase
MRKHASWYLKGIRGNGRARNVINQTETAQELKDYLRQFAEESSKDYYAADTIVV